MPNALNAEGIDFTAVRSFSDMPYAVPNQQVDYAMRNGHVPVGFWRAPGQQNAYYRESFVDELAGAAGKDPLAFRLEHLPAGHRLRGALELAARKAGWGAPLPAGRGRGVACHTSFGSHVAEVAEVSLEKGRPRVHRVVCAVDCGVVVNPDTVEAQIESAVVYGLSAALRGEITVAHGAVVEGNFDDYEPLRMNEMPAVEVHIVPSAEAPGGIGEPGCTAGPPSLANAIAAATGIRLRELPVNRDILAGRRSV
jgi:isoquinoline 1-oxidoreductase beta subunit